MLTTCSQIRPLHERISAVAVRSCSSGERIVSVMARQSLEYCKPAHEAGNRGNRGCKHKRHQGLNLTT